MPRYINPSLFTVRGKEEHGVYTVFLAISAFTILAVAALGVDIGRMYVAESHLQVAVDAASVKVISLVQHEDATTLEGTIRRIVRDNLSERGIHVNTMDDAVVQVTFEEGEDPSQNPRANPREVIVTATIAVDTLLIGRFIGSSTQYTLSSSATAVAKRMFACLAIDTSGSMCEGSFPNGPNNTGCPKVDGLKQGVLDFLDYFKDDDYLSIVKFSKSPGTTESAQEAAIVQNMRRMDEAGRNAIISGINDGGDINPANGAFTNTEDGIFKCRQQFAAVSPPPSDVDIQSIIVFTDGVPNYPAAPQTYPTAAEPCDYQHYSMSVSNGGLSYLPRKMAWYFQSILQADLARDQDNITVYSIGLGPENPYHNSEDIFQGPPGSSIYVADGFLARLANDQVAMDIEQWDNPDNPAVPLKQPDFICMPTNDSIRNTLPGKMYQTNNAGELNVAFSDIGESIRAKLNY